MEALELDTALEELEIRLERLRALYEQYFLGIEKIEPAVARKDVDRRIYVLRHEKIRNTAKRFKLQTIIQRYNTFQQYWQRICREIENGTYKRHMLRAERQFGSDFLTIAAKKRLGQFSRISKPPGDRASEPAARPSEPAPADEVAAPPSVPPVARPAALESAPKRQRLQSGEGKVAGQPSNYESLDLDMDFLGDWDPSKARPSARKPQPKPQAQAGAIQGAPIKPITVPPPAPQAHGGPVKAAPIKPITVPPPAPPPQAAAPAARPPPAPTLLGVGRPPPPPARPIRRESPAKPIAVPPPKPARPASKPDAAPPPALSDDRVRELHNRLIEAKRQTQDTGNVSLEGLSKSLKATEARLREQHKNRRIDFDVVIKDGKAVVKPIVR
jgi:hypothetical protein